ncbi:MAG: DNA polymerase III subunit gamma/tau [Eubacteriales bacterium]|nr:DNA polymerase III subunit gamma/tau [Eubacteriales bacterium]
MYQALYRKWRPQTFDEVIGQKHITDTLKNQVRTGRLSHAYIFIGTRGTGKTTCARILAKAVNCEHPVDGNPCGKCPACLGIADGSVMDVVEMDAASNNKVDNVRALREEAVFSPASVKKRVYIIDEVHMLTTSAFNALLKILEEPPEHLLFILATTELQKVPATILSRCQRHSFHRLETADIAEYLEYVAEKERFDLTHDAADLIARLAEGGLRDALSLLDQCSAAEHIDVESVYNSMGLAGNRQIAAMLENILAHDTASAITGFSKMWMDGKDPGTFLRELSTLLRDIMIVSVAPKSGGSLTAGGYDRQLLNSFSSRLTTEEIISAMETVQRALSSMRDAGNPRTVAELCLVSLCDNTSGDSIASLKARISRLEEDVARGVPVQGGMENYPLRYDRCDTEEERFDVFEEEEPEDPAPVFREEPEPSTDPEPLPAAPDVSWEQIRSKVLPSLPIGIGMNISDPSKLTAELCGNELKLKAQSGFFFNQLNRQEILGKFASAASELCGASVRATITEMNDNGSSRDVNELKAYPEVKFI